MVKIKSKKFHKIKVHHNRWLMWAIAYLLFVAIALVGYLKIINVYFDIDSLAQSNYAPSHSYSDLRLGFATRYPANWSIEADSLSSISFLPDDSQDYGVNVSVVEPNAEPALRRTLKITKETMTDLGGAPATKIVNDLGGGKKETIIMATRNHKLYVVRGTEGSVARLVQTFLFITKK